MCMWRTTTTGARGQVHRRTATFSTLLTFYTARGLLLPRCCAHPPNHCCCMDGQDRTGFEQTDMTWFRLCVAQTGVLTPSLLLPELLLPGMVQKTRGEQPCAWHKDNIENFEEGQELRPLAALRRQHLPVPSYHAYYFAFLLYYPLTPYHTPTTIFCLPFTFFAGATPASTCCTLLRAQAGRKQQSLSSHVSSEKAYSRPLCVCSPKTPKPAPSLIAGCAGQQLRQGKQK